MAEQLDRIIAQWHAEKPELDVSAHGRDRPPQPGRIGR